MDSSKKRTVNFRAKEIGILMSLVLKYKSTVECKKTDKTNNELKQKAWEQLSDEFNSICGEPYRDAKVLRGKYENKKKRSKQKFADGKAYLQGTGGGPEKPKTFDDIDEKIKDILDTQVTGSDSEFGGDVKYKNTQMEGGHTNISDSEPLEEEVKDSDEEEISLPEVISKRRKIEVSQVICKSAPSCSTALLTDWTKMTPDKLRTPTSKPLKTILRKASGKENTNVLSNKINLWAASKAECVSQQRDFLEKEHLLRIELMKERHKHQMALDTKESDQRLLLQGKKAELDC